MCYHTSGFSKQRCNAGWSYIFGARSACREQREVFVWLRLDFVETNPRTFLRPPVSGRHSRWQQCNECRYGLYSGVHSMCATHGRPSSATRTDAIAASSIVTATESTAVAAATAERTTLGDTGQRRRRRRGRCFGGRWVKFAESDRIQITTQLNGTHIPCLQAHSQIYSVC